jgi:hypothetical protein
LFPQRFSFKENKPVAKGKPAFSQKTETSNSQGIEHNASQLMFHAVPTVVNST